MLISKALKLFTSGRFSKAIGWLCCSATKRQIKQEKLFKEQNFRILITSEVQHSIIDVIKANRADTKDFTNGQLIKLNTLRAYLLQIDKNVIYKVLAEWNIYLHNEGIFIPGK